ncbi:MFS transporter [Phormidesmis priestleyi ULC007]|uniref:MFS transporter n=1 Tax=Phormidesmis priestleyi ULC007 TaxID=1920490 RepID=A0A2T1DDR0_9CYAN|nr:MFS transporter [Phormidesmis priestleyi]PSB18594.1 MFS transporter [Phormidesmis priestleyi ULC007]PZO49758.1 MAG: MFS transporter [Phormidesmis priestleyi]
MEQAQTVQLGRRGFWAISLTLFMIAYNVSVVPAIMPSIVQDLDSSVGYIQSILVLFSLVTASFAPTTENLCRFYGRTRVFVIGLIVYGIGIVLTSLSPTIAGLTVSFALLTGLAATPLISAPWTIADLFCQGKAAERAILVLIVASSLGGLSGGLLGGYLASNFSWRWAFLPSLGVLLVILVLRRSLPKLAVLSQQPIDWVGGLLSFLGLGSILLGVSLAGEFGWWEPKRVFSVAGLVIPPFQLSIVPTLMAVGMITLGFFVFWQRRQADRCGASLLRAGLLRKRGFVLGVLTSMLHVLITTGVQFNLYQFVPVALSLNPFRTALTVIPYNLTMIIVVVAVLKYLPLSGRFVPKYVLHTGIALLAGGIWTLYISLHLQVTSLELMPGLIIMGVGSGLFVSYITGLTYSTASVDEKPEGSGIYNPAQNLGSSLGRAILGTLLVFFASRDIVDGILQQLGKTLEPAQRGLVIAELQEMIQTLSREEIRTVLVNKVPPSIYPMLRSINLEAVNSGMKTSLLIALMFTGICFLFATTLPKYPATRS